METVQSVATGIFVLIGTAFSILGILGLLRMPDIYTRLHATGKVGIYGVVLLLIAAGIWTPVHIGKILILIFFIMLTGPITAHAISSASYRLGIKMKIKYRDDLAEQFRSMKN